MQNNKINDQYITLSDIINIIIKRKFLIIICALSGLIMGTIWVYSIPKKQEYRAIISLGHYGYTTKNGALVFNSIFSPEAIVARINFIYLPLIKSEYFKDQSFNFSSVQIVPLSDNTSIIMKALIKPSNAAIYEKLFNNVLAKLIADEKVRKDYYILLLQNQLASMKEQLNLTDNQLKALNNYTENFNNQDNKQLLVSLMHPSAGKELQASRQSWQKSNNIINFLGEFDAEEMSYYMDLLKNNVINYEIYTIGLKTKIQALEQELGQVKQSSFLVAPGFNPMPDSISKILTVVIIVFLASAVGIFFALCKEFFKR